MAATFDERRLRHEIAACSRILNMEGILGYSGHVTHRLDGNRFLIQGFDQSRATVGPDDLLVCDAEGNKLSGPTDQKPPAETSLHVEIFRARPDVMAIAHFHDDLTNVFTVVEDRPLVPLKNHAVRWKSGIPVHPDPSHVAGRQLGEALARTLGPHHACQIRAHGQVITAESVRALLIDSVHFVENAHALYQAYAIGKPVPLTVHEMHAMEEDFHRDRHVAKLWKYYMGQGLEAGVLPEEWADVIA